MVQECKVCGYDEWQYIVDENKQSIRCECCGTVIKFEDKKPRRVIGAPYDDIMSYTFPTVMYPKPDELYWKYESLFLPRFPELKAGA